MVIGVYVQLKNKLCSHNFVSFSILKFKIWNIGEFNMSQIVRDNLERSTDTIRIDVIILYCLRIHMLKIYGFRVEQNILWMIELRRCVIPLVSDLFHGESKYLLELSLKIAFAEWRTACVWSGIWSAFTSILYWSAHKTIERSLSIAHRILLFCLFRKWVISTTTNEFLKFTLRNQ